MKLFSLVSYITITLKMGGGESSERRRPNISY
jgi:hypothetical protein